MTAPLQALYIASCCDDASGGVTVFGVEPASGALRRVDEHLGIPLVRALALHPHGHVLYCAAGAAGGTVVAIAIRGESLRALGARASGGDLPCSLTVDPTGRFLLVAHYLSGDITIHRLVEDGGIGELCDVIGHVGDGPAADRQDASHLHQIVFDPDGANVLVTDLGADAIYAYRLDAATGTLHAAPVSRTSTPPGSGPRHLAFHPSGRVVVADELSSTVSLYDYRSDTGELGRVGSVPASMRDSGVANYPGEVTGSPGGFIFVANRGHDTIAAFQLGTRGLERVCEVATETSWPQHFVVSGTRLYCAGQESDSIATLTMDAQGALAVDAAHAASVASPSWIVGSYHSV